MMERPANRLQRQGGSRRHSNYGRGSGRFREYFFGDLKLSPTCRHELDLPGQMRE
jgi:hypothetical protein